MILKTVTAAIFVNFILITFSFSQTSDSFFVGQQPVILGNTHQRMINSEINGIDYKLYVSVPASYSSSTNSYPVVYLLDADYSFALAKNITDHLSERNHLKEVILVGIAYAGEKSYQINRTRDYTPRKSLIGGYSKEIQEQYSGGGGLFLAFLESELIPFINSEYRTSEERIITGHSYGGLFSSWVLLTKPNLFDGYIIVSPSLWYDEHFLIDLAAEKLSKIDQTKMIYLTVGDREVNASWNMPDDLKKFQTKLQNLSNQNLNLRLEIESDQTHNSVFPIGLSDGLRFVLKGI